MKRTYFKEYAVYRLDEFVCLGTSWECAEFLGMTRVNFRKITQPAYKRNATTGSLFAYEIEGSGYDVDLSKRLKEIRDDLMLTQKEMAELIGVSRSTYQKTEKGISHMFEETLLKAADALCMTIEELMIGDEN